MTKLGPKEKAREYNLKRYFGITLEDYNRLLKRQKNRCAICEKPASSFKRNLSVDHDHTTGEIFGLLCFQCNHLFVGNQRNPKYYANASKYLSKGSGLFVPEEWKKGRRKRRRRKKK